MDYLKPTVLLLAASLMAASAAAQQTAPEPAAPRAKATPAEIAAATKRQQLKRRSVQQVIDSMPAATPVVTEGYRPTLTPAAPVPGAPPAPVPPPVQINSCDAGGCTDTNGVRYNGGVGNTVISPQGRLCTGSGPTLQCF